MGKIAFVYPGQGAQKNFMGQDFQYGDADVMLAGGTESATCDAFHITSPAKTDYDTK